VSVWDAEIEESVLEVAVIVTLIVEPDKDTGAL
jgi:hypothetical protein